MTGYIGKRGREVYKQPPEGWIRKGLKVSKIFDNGDDKWLSTGEESWPVAYHGFKYGNIVLPKVI